MKCPLDETELMMTERSGIEIDYCPKCRGVWLDRGELDKIIERAAEPPPAARVREEPAPAPAPAQPGRPWQEPARDGYRHGKEFGRGDGRRHDDDDDDRRGRGRRRGSILDDLFDF
ncbi:hypothetical protein EDC65_5181 [Stella humosa]|uniref:Transcription factor zinc-finger domain-containing protein n=1 Tax=Stella humosa TaxID=94 RepID=A0A3N1KVH9_9PROT|nr:zf-TFIIB domain-containing protein [Stella humosa]ROP81325.1 hypothetical protein EDC65_5181 [Stella humosa]BBK32674.1 hypothetical protein STHU_33080 [Stella humosa]